MCDGKQGLKLAHERLPGLTEFVLLAESGSPGLTEFVLLAESGSPGVQGLFLFGDFFAG